MSRATSGLAISAASSAIRFSSAAISASIVSGWRGFLMILTRAEPDSDDGADRFWPDLVVSLLSGAGRGNAFRAASAI